MRSKPFTQCDPDARAKLAKKHWPKGISRDRAANERFRLGWPYLRVIVEGGDAVEGEREFRRTDPEMFVEWPRAAARRFLESMQPKMSDEDRADALVAASVSLAPGYPFKWEHAMFLLEHELGPESMAERIIACLEGIDDAAWADSNPHNKLLVLVFCLECFLLRSDRRTAAALADRVRAIVKTRDATTLLAQRLHVTVHGKGPVGPTNVYVDLYRYITTDRSIVRGLLSRFPAARLDPQLLWIFGPKLVKPAMTEAMRRDAAWKQKERRAIFGPIDHPIVREMLGTQAKSKAASEKLTRAQLDREARACIAKLVKELGARRGKTKDEKRLWTAAVHELIELRAAAGHPSPSQLLLHILGLDGWGNDPCAFDQLRATREEAKRWSAYIRVAQDP